MQLVIDNHAELLPGLRREEITLIPVRAGGTLANIQPHNGFPDALPAAQQPVAEEAAACQNRKARAKRNIVVVARPDFADRAVGQGDFFHLITRHPHAALRDKLALELGMQANAGDGRGQGWQQAERAGQTIREPAPEPVVA